MKIKIVIALLICIIFTQCYIPSIHPLWSKDKLAFLPELNGTWLNENSTEDMKAVWEFTGGFNEKENRADDYELVYTEMGAKAIMEVHLVKLGETLFFDFFPGEPAKMEYEGKTMGFLAYDYKDEVKPDINLNSLFFEHVLPIHTFAKVEVETDSVKIYRFDSDYIEKLFKERRVRIQHEETAEGSIVLTAPTADLQKFFEKYANDEKAFSEPIVLIRQRD